MKKLIVALLVLALLLVVSAVAFAEMPAFSAPTIPVPSKVYMLDVFNHWVNPVDCFLGAHARAYISGWGFGMCDKKEWTQDITNHVSVSQWINYTFLGTRWDWQIRKWGTFATDSITFAIQSNDDVTVTFSGFDDLKSDDPNNSCTIPVSYSYGPWTLFNTPPADGSWVTPEQLNTNPVYLTYDMIKNGMVKSLWNKIEVSQDTRADEYENTGTVTLTLSDVKPFINEGTGEYQ